MTIDRKKKRRSPYARYNKRPFIYSPEYQQWRFAVVNRRDDVAAADFAWRKKWVQS